MVLHNDSSFFDLMQALEMEPLPLEFLFFHCLILLHLQSIPTFFHCSQTVRFILARTRTRSWAIPCLLSGITLTLLMFFLVGFCL